MGLLFGMCCFSPLHRRSALPFYHLPPALAPTLARHLSYSSRLPFDSHTKRTNKKKTVNHIHYEIYPCFSCRVSRTTTVVESHRHVRCSCWHRVHTGGYFRSCGGLWVKGCIDVCIMYDCGGHSPNDTIPSVGSFQYTYVHYRCIIIGDAYIYIYICIGATSDEIL